MSTAAPTAPYADPSNLRDPAALARFVGVMAIGLVIDLWTKALAVAHLMPATPGLPPREVEFLPGWLHFTYVENHGAVFGLGQGMRWLFLIVSVLALGLLTWLFKNSGRARGYQIVLGMLLAGVLGNMYDRMWHGYVRDMIHALPGWRWPQGLRDAIGFLPREVFPWVFNIADTLLCVGVALSILYSLIGTPQATDAVVTDAARESA